MKNLIIKEYECFIDDEDYEKVCGYNWKIVSNHGNRYICEIRRRVRGENPTAIFMHRLILNTPDGLLTDHINGNRLDNRKENLRICTNAENSRNKKLQKDNTSGYKGVVKSGKKWCARIRVGKKRKTMGSFVNKVDAARAYNKAAIKYFGEFAKLNKI